MKRKVLALSALFLAVIMMSGCARIRLNIVVKDSGVMDIELLYAMSDTLAAYAGSMSGSSSGGLNSETLDEARKNGFSVTDYSQDGYTGYVFKKHRSASASENETILGNGMTLTKDGNRYILDLPWSSGTSGSDAETLAQSSALIASQGGYAEVVITLPSKPLSNNATSVSADGKTLTWNLFSMGDRKSIHVEYTLNPLWWIWIAVAAAAALIVLIIVIVIIKKATDKKKGEAASVEDEKQKEAESLSYNENTTEQASTVEETLIKEEAITEETGDRSEDSNN